MKILYITRKFPPSIGGMQTQSYQFYKCLSRKCDVQIISWGGSQVFLPVFIVYAALKAVILLMIKRADIIQLGDIVLSPLGVFLKVLFKNPVLTVSHGRDANYSSFIYDHLVIGSARKLDKIICVSEDLKNKLVSRGMLSERITVIPNGILADRQYETVFERTDSLKIIKDFYGIDLENKRIILSMSRLVKKKGIEGFLRGVLPEIVRIREDAVFIIAGDGPEKENILKGIKEAGLKDRVHMLGFIENGSDAYNALFGAADIFVMPNVRVRGDSEGFGIVALEAGINGLPVLAYDVDGLSEAIRDGENGILVEEGNKEKYTAILSELLKDSKKRKNIGQKSKEFVVNNFSWDKIGNRYRDLYTNVLKSD